MRQIGGWNALEKNLKNNHLGHLNGALERNNLEPFDGDQLLSELVNWADILKSEPDVIHRLAVLSEAQNDESQQEQDHVPEPPECGL